ncbi:MAG: hypothetical protein RMM53_10315 [Bacteroidia bacterium]|nr:hypothetical protein [Bacteroidia bacterium]MDW8334596.1 hypothetical protein [Bacteroidia bacterium]
MKSARLTEPPLKLALRALGGPKEIALKLWRMAESFALILNVPESNRRLRKLQALGYCDRIPNHAQLVVASFDQLRFFIVPAAYDFYESIGIDFNFHQILRILDDPVAVMDPIGIRTSKQGIIGHLLQVVHTSPLYDLQLLRMWDDGLDEMEKQTRQMIDGSHPRFRQISAVNEDPQYFVRLLDYIRRFKVSLDENEPFERRSGVAQYEFAFLLAEYQFRSLPGFLRYANRLPKGWRALLRHYRRCKALDYRLCDPEVCRRAARDAQAHHRPVPEPVLQYLSRTEFSTVA